MPTERKTKRKMTYLRQRERAYRRRAKRDGIKTMIKVAAVLYVVAALSDLVGNWRVGSIAIGIAFAATMFAYVINRRY